MKTKTKTNCPLGKETRNTPSLIWIYLRKEEGGDLPATIFHFVLQCHGCSKPTVSPVPELGPLAIHGHLDVRRMHGDW